MLSTCPEAEILAAMTDLEFESYVAGRLSGLSEEDYDWSEEDPSAFDISQSGISDRCPECGEYGACGYDSLGRPMIHVVSPDEEQT